MVASLRDYLPQIRCKLEVPPNSSECGKRQAKYAHHSVCRFVFRRLPYGISSNTEFIQKQMNTELVHLEGRLPATSTTLVTGRNQAEHNNRLHNTLTRISKSSLTSNPDKCVFSRARLEYLGQIIEKEVVKKHPTKVKTIVDMPEPKGLSDPRRCFGMVKQVMKFCPHVAKMTQPLHDVLNRGTT